MRQAGQAELVEAGQKFFEMLASEQTKHPVAGHLRPLAGGHHQLQAKQISMMQMGLRLDGLQIVGRVARRMVHGALSNPADSAAIALAAPVKAFIVVGAA